MDRRPYSDSNSGLKPATPHELASVNADDNPEVCALAVGDLAVASEDEALFAVLVQVRVSGCQHPHSERIGGLLRVRMVDEVDLKESEVQENQ